MTHPFIEVRSVSKTYGGVQALSDVSLDIGAGEVHALCGENGAGKSTLIKILSGSVTPDSGQILIRSGTAAGASPPAEIPLKLGDVHASEAASIAVIHQESVAFAHLSSYDNIFVGREPRRFGGLLLDRKRMRRETRALLDRLNESLDPARPVAELSLAQRQMVGIARALSRDCRLLIMDEPTASLSQRETRVLFRLIRQFREQGVSILYVSHRLDEVFELADRVTVLRDGKYIATSPVSAIMKNQLIQLMVGRELIETDTSLSRQTPPARHHRDAPPLLEVKSLSRAGAFTNVCFDVRAGEIVGMAGLVGAGRSEVARAIFGVDRADSGTVLIGGSPLAGASVRQAMDRGVAMIPEDRQHLGLVLPLSVGTNLSMAVLRSLTRFGLTSAPKERALIEKLMHDLSVKAPGPTVPAETLSGGNQQKLVIGKWLATNPRVLILDEPTRGVDVGAKAEVHRLIRKLADEGMATLLISSDLPEILAMSDRILVMCAGRIAGELGRDEATQEKVLSLAIAAGAGGAAA